jgi:hypothetical protein
MNGSTVVRAFSLPQQRAQTSEKQLQTSPDMSADSASLLPKIGEPLQPPLGLFPSPSPLDASTSVTPTDNMAVDPAALSSNLHAQQRPSQQQNMQPDALPQLPDHRSQSDATPPPQLQDVPDPSAQHPAYSKFAAHHVRAAGLIPAPQFTVSSASKHATHVGVSGLYSFNFAQAAGTAGQLFENSVMLEGLYFPPDTTVQTATRQLLKAIRDQNLVPHFPDDACAEDIVHVVPLPDGDAQRASDIAYLRFKDAASATAMLKGDITLLVRVLPAGMDAHPGALRQFPVGAPYVVKHPGPVNVPPRSLDACRVVLESAHFANRHKVEIHHMWRLLGMVLASKIASVPLESYDTAVRCMQGMQLQFDKTLKHYREGRAIAYVTNPNQLQHLLNTAFSPPADKGVIALALPGYGDVVIHIKPFQVVTPKPLSLLLSPVFFRTFLATMRSVSPDSLNNVFDNFATPAEMASLATALQVSGIAMVADGLQQIRVKQGHRSRGGVLVQCADSASFNKGLHEGVQLSSGAFCPLEVPGPNLRDDVPSYTHRYPTPVQHPSPAETEIGLSAAFADLTDEEEGEEGEYPSPPLKRRKPMPALRFAAGTAARGHPRGGRGRARGLPHYY